MIQTCRMCVTRSLAVEDLRGKEATSGFLCDVGVVQLTETADRGQEQVPQPRLPSFQLENTHVIVRIWSTLMSLVHKAVTAREQTFSGF